MTGLDRRGNKKCYVDVEQSKQITHITPTIQCHTDIGSFPPVFLYNNTDWSFFKSLSFTLLVCLSASKFLLQL